jgi:hypothetical protein
MTDQATAMRKVLDDIRMKRQRQIVIHSHPPEEDDRHADGSVGIGAIPYIQAANQQTLGLKDKELQTFWPWPERFKPSADPRENLINAAALLVAEIERIDREAAKVREVER